MNSESLTVKEKPMRPLTLSMLVIISQLTIGCAGFMTEEVAQEPRDDAVIATRIKAQLIESSELDAAAIRVESDQGQVTLDGFVETKSQKDRAEALAKQVTGVKQIVNKIEVKQ